MTHKVYSTISTKSWRDVRYGETGNGPSSNNEYYHDLAFADGVVITTQNGRYQYQPPSVRDYNRLHRKFVEEIHKGTQGELLTAGVEWKKSLDMVTQRTLWILDSYKSFRRFDLPAVVRKLSQPVGRPVASYSKKRNERGFQSFNKRSVKKTSRANVTETWLEYWLGWAPAMGDIFNALDVLTNREFPNCHISIGTGFRSEDKLVYNKPPIIGFDIAARAGVVGCYADAQVTNYNLYLANQLGLINPMKTGFDIIPLSFVAGWFVNVGQVLGALTAYAGVKLTNTGIGIRQVTTGQIDQAHYLTEWVGSRRVAHWKPVKGSSYAISKRRHPGTLPYPKLTTTFDRLSLTRAATAVSLLTELFLRKRD